MHGACKSGGLRRCMHDPRSTNSPELLAPPRSQRAECQQDIKIALDRVEHGAAAAQSFRVAGSKKGKAEVMRYCAALRRLRNAYHGLGPAIRPWFSLSETAYIAGKPTMIDREIALAEVFLVRLSPPPRPDASRNKLAVAAAYDVLNWRSQRAMITRNGKRAKLILAGDMSVDLFDHMREFRRGPSRSIEKVRGANAILYQTRRR
jgi:hypothetical protein